MKHLHSFLRSVEGLCLSFLRRVTARPGGLPHALRRSLGIAVLAWLACLSPCLAEPFQGGLHTSRTAQGTISWQLFFSQKQGAKSYTVTGQFGDGALAIAVNGRYDPTANILHASMFKPVTIADAFGWELPMALIEVGGSWDAGVEPGFVVAAHGFAKEKLKRDPNSPEPGEPLLEIKLDIPSPQVMGTELKGTGRLRVCGVTKPVMMRFKLSIEEGLTVNRGEYSGWLSLDEDSEHEFDLDQLVPTTIPVVAGDHARVLMNVDTNFPVVVVNEPVVALTRPAQSISVVKVAASAGIAGVKNVAIEGRPATFTLNYGLQLDRAVEARVEQHVSIEPFGDATEAIHLPKRDFITGASPNGVQITASEGTYRFEAPRAGRYRVRYSISGDDVIPYSGSVIFDVEPPLSAGAGGNESKPKPKIVLTGGVTVSPAKIKVGEKCQANISLTNPDKDEGVEVDCTLRLWKVAGWGTKEIGQKPKKYSIGKGETRKSEASLNLTEPGEYVLELLGAGDRIEIFRSEATIIVEEKDPTPTNTGTVTPPANTTQTGGKGKFGLVKKQLGKIPPTTEGPHGTSSGGIGESSFNATYTVKAPGEGSFSCQLGWVPPPAVLKAGDIIELKSRGSASANGRDVPNLGVDAAWGVGGSAAIIEKKGGTYSGKGGDGKFYPSSDCTYRVKIEEGGTITLTAFYYGVAWGTGSMEPPCIYTYQWEADPTAQAGTGTGTQTGTKPGEPSENGEPGASSLTWNVPDEPGSAHQIEAWLDPAEITLFAGEPSKIIHVHIRNYRRDTAEDRVEVLFPQKTDNWASLPGQIVVNGGDGSYWPPNMGTPEHVDGYFFSARRTAPGGTFTIWWIVRQKGAGAVRIPLTVKVIPKPGMVTAWGASGQASGKTPGPITSTGGLRRLPRGGSPGGKATSPDGGMKVLPAGAGPTMPRTLEGIDQPAQRPADSISMSQLPPGKLSADSFAAAGVQLTSGAGIPALYPVEPSMVVPQDCKNVMLLADKHTTAFTLSMNPGVKRIALQRIGTRNGASLPTWKMTAYDAAGNIVGTVGEQRGLPLEPRIFDIKGTGIARIVIEADNLVNGAPWSTWSSLPITGFTFDR